MGFFKNTGTGLPIHDLVDFGDVGFGFNLKTPIHYTVGDLFRVDLKSSLATLKIVGAGFDRSENICELCFFHDVPTFKESFKCNFTQCMHQMRPDRRDVYFKLIKHELLPQHRS